MAPSTKWVDVTKTRQYSVEFATVKIHKTYQSKYKNRQNFAKKRIQNVEQWLLALDLAGWHISRYHTWLHSDTEFPFGLRVLAFSKILSILSGLAPGLFQNFFKIHPDCYQASPTIARGPSTRCFKFQKFSDLLLILAATWSQFPQ